jgi:hypothetical protein
MPEKDNAEHNVIPGFNIMLISAMKMEAVCTSETLVSIYEYARLYSPE